MRIDAINRVSQLYQANSTKRVVKAGSVEKFDSVQISQMGKDYQIAKNAVAAAPDVRAEKVNAIKQALASGTYNVSMEEVADKLINNSFNLSI